MLKNVLTVAFASLLLASPAKAVFIAGWDFSQYLADAAPTIDGSSLATTLPANYSDFDPTFGAGAESAAFGTLFLDGSNGSDATTGTDFVPSANVPTLGGSLPVNGTPSPDVAFDSFTVLSDEGQLFTQNLSMLGLTAFDAVFSADVSSLLGGTAFGEGWSLDFSGRSLQGGATVTVEASADGVSYTSFGNVNLASTEALFDVSFGTAFDGADQVFVRLGFSTGEPLIDNLGISAAQVIPEPGTVVLLLAGIAGLGLYGRSRRA